MPKSNYKLETPLNISYTTVNPNKYSNEYPYYCPIALNPKVGDYECWSQGRLAKDCAVWYDLGTGYCTTPDEYTQTYDAPSYYTELRSITLPRATSPKSRSTTPRFPSTTPLRHQNTTRLRMLPPAYYIEALNYYNTEAPKYNWRCPELLHRCPEVLLGVK